MALYENKIVLRGFTGKDAESFATKQQRTFVVLSLATKSGYKDKQTNEWVNHTEWHRIVAFGKVADAAKGLKKGDYVEVEGELRSSEFEVEAGEGRKKVTVKRRGWEVRAGIVRRLSPPPAPSQSAELPTDSAPSAGWDAEPVGRENAA